MKISEVIYGDDVKEEDIDIMIRKIIEFSDELNIPIRIFTHEFGLNWKDLKDLPDKE